MAEKKVVDFGIDGGVDADSRGPFVILRLLTEEQDWLVLGLDPDAARGLGLALLVEACDAEADTALVQVALDTGLDMGTATELMGRIRTRRDKSRREGK